MYLLMYCMFKVYEIHVFGTPVLRSDLDRRQSFGLIDVLVPVVCTDSTAGLSLNFRRRACQRPNFVPMQVVFQNF